MLIQLSIYTTSSFYSKYKQGTETLLQHYKVKDIQNIYKAVCDILRNYLTTEEDWSVIKFQNACKR